jgi:hypothetical protein
MVEVAEIVKTFSNWPAEVVDPWLLEFANDPDMAWPPKEPYGDHRWGRLLGQRPVSWWKDVSWVLEEVDCGISKLTPKTRTDIADIRQEISGGAPSETTKRRWDNIFRFVLNAGTFPVAPVLIRRPEGLSLIDGTHRLAVLNTLQSMPAQKFASLGLAKPAVVQSAWIGKHKDNELPLSL